MNKKDAIERLAQELEARDLRQFDEAFKAAGAAAEVTRIVKDYEALAKEYMARAETELAFDRAMLQVNQIAPLDVRKYAPLTKGKDAPTHQLVLRNGEYFWYTPGVAALEHGECLQDYINSGWTPTELRNCGFIL